MGTFVRVWFQPIFDQAYQWGSVDGSTEASGLFTFSWDEKVHTSIEYTYEEILETVAEKIQDLGDYLTMAAEDPGLEYPSIAHGPPSISPASFSETLVSVLVLELLAQYGDLEPSARVRQSLLSLPTSASRTRTFGNPKQERILPSQAQVDRFFLRGQAIECAVDQQDRVFCGSSATIWGTFKSTKLNVLSPVGSSTTVDEWFRSIRQNRFSVSDQAKLNDIINGAFLEFYCLQQIYVAQKGLDPDQAAAEALVAKYSSSSSPLCSSMRRGANRPECWAQSYDGFKLDFKDKCTMCKAVFHLRTVTEVSPQISKDFAEKSSTAPRGECAEALVHVPLFRDNNIPWQ
ncbi:hypothetical protein MMC26_004685 [Xylographa opegraphella]|nr:hypothetical protein [Xylographa opegraphella]